AEARQQRLGLQRALARQVRAINPARIRKRPGEGDHVLQTWRSHHRLREAPRREKAGEAHPRRSREHSPRRVIGPSVSHYRAVEGGYPVGVCRQRRMEEPKCPRKMRKSKSMWMTKLFGTP